MKKLFPQVLIILSISLLSISFINLQNVYAAGLDREAKTYREKGYEAQENGDIDGAIVWYQKASSLDPDYAAPHNDLGILFEAKGWLDRAESEYQKALALEPDYEKAHANLALLYERRGELEKAAFHWMRRYRLGRPGDAWTDEARQRLEKLGLVGAGEKTIQKKSLPKEQEVMQEIKPKEPEAKDVGGWTKVGSAQKEQKKVFKKARQAPEKVKKETTRDAEIRKELDEKPRAKAKPEKAKKKKKAKEKKSEWTRLGGAATMEKKTKTSSPAIDKELEESLRLAEQRLREEKNRAKPETPAVTKKTVAKKTRSTSGARTYYAKAHDYYKKGEYTRAMDEIRAGKKEYPDDASLLELEQVVKNTMKEERIEDHYNEGIMRYREDDYSGAKKEFEAILNILPE